MNLEYIANRMGIKLELELELPGRGPRRSDSVLLYQTSSPHSNTTAILPGDGLSNLVHGALLLPREPSHYARLVKLAEALQSRHLVPYIVLHEADRALLGCAVFPHAVLLRGNKGQHTRWCRRGRLRQ